VLAVALLAATSLALAGSALGGGWPAYPSGGWLPQGSGTGDNLLGVAFTDRDHGWVAAEGRTLLVTTDGGVYWRSLPVDVGADIDAVTFADELHGWVVDEQGGLSGTTDGGVSWEQQVAPEKDCHRLVAADALHAWTLSGDTEVVRTADGVTWDVTPTGAADTLNDIAFADDTHGWAVGSNGAIVATTDGGSSWQAQTSGTTGSLWAVSFVDAQRGWAAGNTGVGYAEHALVLATTDGGSTWAKVFGGSRGEIDDVWFADPLHGWATSGWYFAGRYRTIEATTDGGVTWKVQWTGPLPPNAVTAVDADHAWVVGSTGMLLATGDGGVSSDTTPPVSDPVKLADRWYDHHVSIHFTAVDGFPASGVAYNEWRLDGEALWRQGSAVVSANGVHTVWHRAVDAAGNAEAAHAVKVRIDTKPPRIIGERVSSVAAGGLVTIQYKVADHTPCGPWARGVRLTLTGYRTGVGEYRAQTVRIGRVRVNTWHALRFRCGVEPGLYLTTMEARDDAGNAGGGYFGNLLVR